jgi:uncharacterized pyridoxamine 5'-phosphate oxidase family protein
MKQLDYEEKINEVMNILKNEKPIVLCTSNGNKVAARTVYYFLFNDCIYFVTSKAYKKCKQIEKNHNVALCIANIQIEGVATILGHPKLDENNKLLEYTQENCPEISNYTKHKNTVIIEIKINNVEMWLKGREYINYEDKTAYRIG